MFNLLTGFYAPDAGRVLLDGRDITELSPAARAREGVTRTFQNIRLLDELSALDNLTTAMHGELNGSLIDMLLPTRRRSQALAQAQAMKSYSKAILSAPEREYLSCALHLPLRALTQQAARTDYQYRDQYHIRGHIAQ